MKAFQITAPGESRITDVPEPTVSAGQVLLRVRQVGFCGSDLSTFQGRNPMVTYPRIPGHEIGAEIVEVGDGVPAELRPGQAVTVVPYSNCGECASCRRGRAYACKHNQTLGVQRDGAMTEWIVAPWEKIIAVPGLGVRELALVEPLTVGFHAAARGRAEKGDIAAVFGCGMIGLGAIAGAAAAGATVIAIDIDDQKLALAKKLGATHGINSRTQDLHARLQELTGGHGPDLIIEAVGHPATYRAAVDEVAFTGRVVCIGYAKDEVSFATKLFVQKEIDIMGSRNASADDFRAVCAYLQQPGFPYDEVITRTVSLDGAGEALAAWSANPGAVTKIHVTLA
ncbi:MAG: zinc-binding alcohol dehydrogenase family protein [Verrucomicrobiota bacterium JB022]|nr:zinc-binding alcohol dehydrogenase family protein [Verrucomicrobiota bacterium JB022]